MASDTDTHTHSVFLCDDDTQSVWERRQHFSCYHRKRSRNMVYTLLPLATTTPLPQPYFSVLMDLTDKYSFQVGHCVLLWYRVTSLCMSHRALNLELTTSLIRSSSTTDTARDAHDLKRPFKVTQGHPLFCQSTRHV